MSTNRVFVDFHVLQTVPPNCINRDDTGSPKTAVYGGVTRARVSSQSWKRAIRLDFNKNLDVGQVGIRTKNIADLIAQSIQAQGGQSDEKRERKRITTILEAAGVKQKEKKTPGAKGGAVEQEKQIDKADDSNQSEGSGKQDALFFISRAQVDALAKLALSEVTLNDKELKDAAIKALQEHPSIDIALFGRMLANEASLNYDACAQVAHSISTHRVETEYDYFTAIDDCQPETQTGAGHIGTVEFNAATYYRYATVSVHALHELLKQDTVNAVVQFARSFVLSMPTGKQNTFANRTVPDAVLVVVRDDQPINLVGAFEKPVVASMNGYLEESAKRLTNHAQSLYRNFANQPVLTLATGDLLADLALPMSFPVLLEKLTDYLSRQFKPDGDAE